MAVIQILCKGIPEVTPTKYKSLEKLSSIMSLVSIEDFIYKASLNNLLFLSQKIHPLKSGKEFLEIRLI